MNTVVLTVESMGFKEIFQGLAEEFKELAKPETLKVLGLLVICYVVTWVILNKLGLASVKRRVARAVKKGRVITASFYAQNVPYEEMCKNDSRWSRHYYIYNYTDPRSGEIKDMPVLLPTGEPPETVSLYYDFRGKVFTEETITNRCSYWGIAGVLVPMFAAGIIYNYVFGR